MTGLIFYRGLRRRGQEREKKNGNYVKRSVFPSYSTVQGTRRSVTQEMAVVTCTAVISPLFIFMSFTPLFYPVASDALSGWAEQTCQQAFLP